MLRVPINISSPNDQNFAAIKNYIRNYELDNRELTIDQFIVAKRKNEILGFARKRKHATCYELCSLGVTEQMRHKGIGKLLVKAITDSLVSPLYLVCVIPDFFEQLGFKIVNTFPDEIKTKLIYCTQELTVPEKYVVMKYF